MSNGSFSLASVLTRTEAGKPVENTLAYPVPAFVYDYQHCVYWERSFDSSPGTNTIALSPITIVGAYCFVLQPTTEDAEVNIYFGAQSYAGDPTPHRLSAKKGTTAAKAKPGILQSVCPDTGQGSLIAPIDIVWSTGGLLSVWIAGST